MRCDEVAALLPALVDGDDAQPRGRAPRRVVPAVPGRVGALPPAAAHAPAAAHRATSSPRPATSPRRSPRSKRSRSAASSGPRSRAVASPTPVPAPRSATAAATAAVLIARSRRRGRSAWPAEQRQRGSDPSGPRNQHCYRSLRPPARRAVAQLEEHRSPKPTVGGSSPSCPAPFPRPEEANA